MQTSLCRVIALSLCAIVLILPRNSLAEVDQEVFVNADFKAADAAGQPLHELDLWSNQLVRWTNRSGEVIVITVRADGRSRGMAHKILAGSSSLRLQPGESVIRRTGTLHYDVKYTTYISRRVPNQGTIAGVGGGPDIVTPPPPK